MTTTIDHSLLVLALWEPYRQQVASGEPVYFSFSRDSVTCSLRELGVESEDCVQLISDAALTLLKIYDSDVEVRRMAFEKNASGFSSMIIFIAQQVLAVEEMVNERGGFSENAYFPRLRRMMSPQLRQISANPFDFTTFESIWRRFAHEIRSLPGSTDQSVSFRFGADSRINKARAFPLSQALLTREDLHVLVRQIGHRAVHSLPRDALEHNIRRESVHLGRRAQQHIALAPLRARIVDQVRAFAAAVPAERFSQPTVDDEQVESLRLEIYKDSTGWTDDDFRVFLHNPLTRSRSGDSAAVREFLARNVTIGLTKCLPLSDFGDSWISHTGTTVLSSGDSFVAINRAETPLNMRSLYPNLEEHVEVILQKSPLDLPEYVVTELRIFVATLSNLLISRDHLILNPPGARKRYEWIGGFCVDNRARKYLLEALPDRIAFPDTEFSATELVAVNRKPYTWEGFQQLLRVEQADTQYDIEFPGRHMARLTVAIRRAEEHERVGFKIEGHGIISPFVEHLPLGSPALVGFDESTLVDQPATVSATESSALLHEVLRQWPNPLPRPLVERVDRAISSQGLPEGTRNFLQQLRAQRSNVRQR